jgi:hypothetical protein
MISAYTLLSATNAHAEAPDTFPIPRAFERESLRVGDLAKLLFHFIDGSDEWVERMWVLIEQVRPETYIGSLDNIPHQSADIELGAHVEFHSDHVIQIERASE